MARIDAAVPCPAHTIKGTYVYVRLIDAKWPGNPELRLELTGIPINQQLQPIVTGDYEVSGKSGGKQSKGQQVKVPSQTMLEFKLEQPLTVQPARSAIR